MWCRVEGYGKEQRDVVKSRGMW
uniref:Uncharacterized protein n=1 Tax=Anguilla anguilla TaxID=7936 RepID=A0A0E9W1F0_ANGAN